MDVEPDALGPLALLAHPLRRALYRAVGAGEWRTRDELAAAVGLPRHVAAFHLERMAGAGLLETGFARPAGRGGPGAGRPAKRYRRAPGEWVVGLPPRRYELLGEVLARSIEARAGDAGALRRAARQAAAEVARDVRRRGWAPLVSALEGAGYDPVMERGRLVLTNCPFGEVAARHPAVVCRINADLVGEIVRRVGGGCARVVERRAPGRCCLEVERISRLR